MDSKTPPNSSSPPRAQVKKENEEEIKGEQCMDAEQMSFSMKQGLIAQVHQHCPNLYSLWDFAETAMNELLGWYGYERLELRRWAASRARDASSPEQTSEQKNKADECSWCNKSLPSEGSALQHAGATFCSELCFSQSRRANFKRAKTCDWCRHVRHTVAYVDFQDGATQLQFCSDKCLNQYKMHIFCRETQAHLDLNPHLVNASSSSNLITPELWLKNCKSRSASPNSERSGSPNPENMPNKPANTEKTEAQKTNRSPLPLITIAPTAKLMKQKRPSDESIPVQKSPETKKDIRNTKMNLRKRRTSKCSATVTSQTVRQRTSTPKAQDLRMCSPSDGSSPASTVGNALHSPPHQMNPHPPPPPFPPNPMFSMPPPMFLDNHDLRHPHNIFPPRLNFMPRPGFPMERPRLPGLPPPLNFPTPIGQAPPVTVLVPYPVILPIPLPIPIPIPFSAFVQAHCANKVKTETKPDAADVEGPLDFTMNSDKNKRDEEVMGCSSEQSCETALDKNPVCEQSNERIEEDKMETDINETGNPEQTLPKFKITRLGNKMAKIVTKSREPSESTRPLRKRRRLVEVTTDDEALIPKTRKIVEV